MDILGNDIIIGACYGYNIQKNGMLRVVIGEACDIIGEKTKLKIIDTGTTACGKPVEKDKIRDKKDMITVFSNRLFRIDIRDKNWKTR